MLPVTHLRLVRVDWKPETVQALYEAYLGGSFGFPRGLSKAEFDIELVTVLTQYTGFWLVISDTDLIAFVFTKYNGWVLEPHVEFFPGHAPRTILQAYHLFFNTVLEDYNIQACLIRSYKNTKRVFDRFCKQGLMSFLRSVPSNDSRGEEYQYVVVKRTH